MRRGTYSVGTSGSSGLRAGRLFTSRTTGTLARAGTGYGLCTTALRRRRRTSFGEPATGRTFQGLLPAITP